MKHIIYILLLAVNIATCMAQERKVQNKPYIDDRKFHYGFFVGIHDQSFQLDNNGYIPPNTDATAGQQ